MSSRRMPFVTIDDPTNSGTTREPATHSGSDVDVAGLELELRRNVEGEVRFDAGSKAMYAVDASNYRQVPIGVVLPKSKEDVVQTIAACRRYGAPVLSRGGGTSLAGQCCNVAIVIDWSKYMRGVLEVNTHERWARVLPGTICDELRDRALKESENLLTWGPDPATHDHCCFGGMIGNNSCGAHAQMSGKTDNNIEALEVLLYDGTRMTLGWMDDRQLDEQIAKGGREGELYASLKSLRYRYSEQIHKKYPHIPRRVSGYNLDQLLPGEGGRFNIARSVIGSEGTLVTVLEAKCKLIDAKAERVILMLGYPDVYEAADHVMDIDPFQPTALEGIDDRLYEYIQKKGGPHTRYLKLLPEGKGWLMAEFGADKQDDVLDLVHRVMETLKSKPNAPSMRLFTDKQDRANIWTLRESGLGATAFVPGEPDTWPGWEDSAVAPEKLGGYLRDLRALFSKYDYHPALYGHFGHGCVHCRVDFELTTQEGIRHWRAFMEEATDLCVKYDGSLSGEHGDGQARAEFLRKMFGEELIGAFSEFKSIWDPDWKMNPGKIVEPNRIDENMRLGTGYRPWEPKTHFHFPNDKGSFAHAALRCVGVGKCRRHSSPKENDQTMCPSYMVTQEERHTTRGRARILWEMLQGDVISEGWRDENVKEALDLCLSCKGCKGDCPVNVDMATYKAEFLSHYWEGRIRPRHAYAFGWIDTWSRMVSSLKLQGLVNLGASTPGVRELVKAATGMSQHRQIPEFAPESFKSWFRRRKNGRRSGKRVVLFPDTFNNHFFPRTARAAVEVLEDAGYQVEVPMAHVCCGRPLYDYGFLDMAESYLENVMRVLMPYVSRGIPVVVLEPSCWSVLRDEINELYPDRHEAHQVMENTFLLSEFLVEHTDYRPPSLNRRGVMHGHCHHKAIIHGAEHEHKLFQQMGIAVRMLADGCCGMAGSFGFEEDKYDVSRQIGEHALVPAVKKAGLQELIIADGFSCREQIRQMTDREALHTAEVIQLAMHELQGTARGFRPEDELVREHRAAIRKSKVVAGVALGSLALAGAAANWYGRKK